jgi:glutamate-5-semialdehyde dehydrogenase
MNIKTLAEDAKKASRELALLSTEQKNRALMAMAAALLNAEKKILKENAKDLTAAKRKGLSAPLIARLSLDSAKLRNIAEGIRAIARLEDPVGRVIWERQRPNGLHIKKVGVPLGLILIIYESRPNVTADCMALCLKSGNAVILKGGSEVWQTNEAMIQAMDKAAEREDVPKDAFRLVPRSAGRSATKQLLEMKDTIDLVIPRGGEGLIHEVARISKIPVIKHYKGVCHVYIDKEADLKKARDIVLNAKTQNPAVCNAAEALLVHRTLEKSFLPSLERELTAKGVKIRRDRKAWGQEFLDLILAVRVVKDIQEAVDHIETYGSRHSDAIVTEDPKAADFFTSHIDSSAVFVNASTRFNDGGEFGMGAEMGISTDKLHARGPMGLEELTSYKYVVLGNGQVRA